MGLRKWRLGYPGFWGKLDWLNHRLDCPPLVGRFGVRLVPRRLRYWICDRFDRAVGLRDDDITEDEFDEAVRTGIPVTLVETPEDLAFESAMRRRVRDREP